jgi:hypothetical protein
MNGKSPTPLTTVSSVETEIYSWRTTMCRLDGSVCRNPAAIIPLNEKSLVCK